MNRDFIGALLQLNAEKGVPQEILIHVLDPNREVSPHFLDYSVRLSDGRVLTGLLGGPFFLLLLWRHRTRAGA